MEQRYYLDSEQIILGVKKYPNLYDMSRADFKNRELKRDAWEAVAKAVVGDAWEQMVDKTRAVLRKEVQNRWKSIRDCDLKRRKEVQNRWKSMRDCYLKSSKYEIEKRDVKKRKRPYIYHKQLSFLHSLYAQKNLSASKPYLEQLLKPNGDGEPLSFDDSNSLNKTKQGESSKPGRDDTVVKTEVIDLDDITENDIDDERSFNQYETIQYESESVDSNDIFIIPDPLPSQAESSPLTHLSQFLVPEHEIGGENYNNAVDGDVKENNRVREQPLYDLTTEPEAAKVGRKRTPSQEPGSSKSPKRKREDHQSEQEPSLPTIKSVVSIQEHPIETFFRSMATTVMSFPPRLAAETRLHVCRIVTEMELRFLTEQSDVSGPAPPQDQSSAFG